MGEAENEQRGPMSQAEAAQNLLGTRANAKVAKVVAEMLSASTNTTQNRQWGAWSRKWGY